MANYTVNGTSGVDIIEAQEVADSLDYYPDGITIYGLDGNDELTSTIVSEDRIDEIYGGGGNDWMAAQAIDTGFAAAMLDGEDGSDHVYLPFNLQNITSVGSAGIEFSGVSQYGGTIDVLVTYRNEIITDITGAHYLVEDLYRGNVRAVSWNEAYARSFNGNQDWFFRGLNTYDSYHSAKPAEANKPFAAPSPSPVTDPVTGRTSQGTEWQWSKGSAGSWKKKKKLKNGDYIWATKGKGGGKRYLVDNDVQVFPYYEPETDSIKAPAKGVSPELFWWSLNYKVQNAKKAPAAKAYPSSIFVYDGKDDIEAWFPNLSMGEYKLYGSLAVS
jgi:hypothetical protein